MKILALDTSTEACSAAIWTGTAVVERHEIGAQHSERILSMIQELLGETDFALTRLDAIAFGRGPGSFTGLRIGAAVAQGLAFGADLPVVPVSSLAALAQGVDAARVLAVFDARMNQVYAGVYVRNAQGLVEQAGPEEVSRPEAVGLPEGHGWVGAGSGWDRYHDILAERLDARMAGWRADISPRARDVASLGIAAFREGKGVAAELALPVYLRDEIAVKAAKT